MSMQVGMKNLGFGANPKFIAILDAKNEVHIVNPNQISVIDPVYKRGQTTSNVSDVFIVGYKNPIRVNQFGQELIENLQNNSIDTQA
jgi:hypothetical protein